MIHPATELKHVNETIGYGVFATALIPKGTIVFAKDELDIEVTHEQFSNLPPPLQSSADKYSYIDERGVRILSWDNAKYVNHSCTCNTMSTGYGFEIALRDIQPGEEITDEYGLFNCTEAIPLACNCSPCRHVLSPDDIDTYHPIWDVHIAHALGELTAVHQPLWDLVDPAAQDAVMSYLNGASPYRSVYGLKYTNGHCLTP